jgi:hypothetical protein
MTETVAETGRPDGGQRHPERLTRDDLQPGDMPNGGTEIVLQRHGEYVREPEHENVGSLTPEAAATERQMAEAYFESLLAGIDEQEWGSLDILFIASDTQYHGGGRRSLETAIIAEEAAQEVLARHGLNPHEHVINLHHPIHGDDQSPRPKAMLREPRMFTESPDFVDALRAKYGEGRDFWVAFEEDLERELREGSGAEGPDDLANRMGYALMVIGKYARLYHQANPDRRLVVWATTHYDTISPFVKREIFGVGKEQYVGVDYGAGMVVDIDAEGAATTTIDGRSYPVSV